MEYKKIGFIGQGFIGKNMADDFAERGYDVVRYALEPEYVENREAIADCDVVFVAVPTPTTAAGFDSSILESTLPLIGKGKVVVIKSTIVPGTTKRLQRTFPDITVIHSPEFLREKQAAEDARKPSRNIIGLPEQTESFKAVAQLLLTILPKAEYAYICKAEEAELVKYGSNGFLALKVVYMNLLYDLAQAVGADYDVVAKAIGADARIGMSHTNVIDTSGHVGAVAGRGAGGHCFPKDLAALREVYEQAVGQDLLGLELLRAIEKKNLQLLRSSGKDSDLLRTIYGAGE